ncbi:uroporphyrinogen-III C-methyltransferase [Vibrio plantisponsor]|uniref:uroporphyrinogen-III C-methyltransferase n=2 Tax=Vibrio plantisponsor TaxID=664643 RepID=A0ABU4IFS9_9VIBR|nr:uroporphyrinogen-III C-methyltransferase [Vibrio plantisponsor]MDW6017405.1 uroporphyrinogen-III C-methyltransferase [Vibrio plantisponsor]NNM40347.1 uroporphyrinogen-III C-methyltransferase [Vibrio plantisponsor]
MKMRSNTTAQTRESFTVHERYYCDTPNLSRRSPSNGKQGFVYLVGAGPNDPDLLTVKALKVIQTADVVVYDRLVGREILDLVNPDAEMVYVGKRCGLPSLKQEETNRLLVEFAQKGLQVVRLKGGDPFIFGRGGEEALELVKHNIAYQVIPGITAAIGCSSSALIPLTHRQVSRSVTLITGQVVTGALPAWAGLVASGQTLVFYMGLENASAIQEGLIQHGLSVDTPVAVVGQGCSVNQTVVTFELHQLTQTANDLKGLSPALIIMGDVVKLREQLIQTAQATRFQAESAHL